MDCPYFTCPAAALASRYSISATARTRLDPAVAGWRVTAVALATQSRAENRPTKLPPQAQSTDTPTLLPTEFCTFSARFMLTYALAQSQASSSKTPCTWQARALRRLRAAAQDSTLARKQHCAKPARGMTVEACIDGALPNERVFCAMVENRLKKGLICPRVSSRCDVCSLPAFYGIVDDWMVDSLDGLRTFLCGPSACCLIFVQIHPAPNTLLVSISTGCQASTRPKLGRLRASQIDRVARISDRRKSSLQYVNKKRIGDAK